jgi:predicted AlkP superfamily phosphohydrolase/phosphomutase
MRQNEKVIVLDLDGLEPASVAEPLASGRLPHLASLHQFGSYRRVATTLPAQTPVAWSTFATGLTPGGHGIFDLLRRDPRSYLPQIAINRIEQKYAFLPPRPVNLRDGVTVRETLSRAGIPSTILRCRCSYPMRPIRGRVLAGMGVPDVRGSSGVSTFYTTDPGETAGESDSLVPLPRSTAANCRGWVTFD